MGNENETGSVDIAGDMIEHEPTVRSEIVDRLEEKNKASEEENEPQTNFQFSTPKENVSSGFNPDIHESNPDGTPRRTKNGDYRRKRGRKQNNSARSSDNNSTQAKESRNTGNASDTVDYANMGAFFSGMLFSGCVATFGETWEPKPEERSNISNAAARYCESVGMQDIPPGIALCLCVGMYALPRFNDPATREKIRDIGVSLGVVKRVKKIPNESENVHG